MGWETVELSYSSPNGDVCSTECTAPILFSIIQECSRAPVSVY